MPNGDLAFAKVSPSSLAKLSNREVLQVHKRFSQSWRKRTIMSVPLEGLSREDFLSRFVFMVAELKRRELDRPDAGPLDDALSRQNPKQEADQPPLSEAFHLRDTHWVDVPESGSCPVSHPTKARFPGKQKQVCFTRSAAAAASQARMREQEELSEGIRPAFGSPGGKRSLARQIVSLIPEHEVYVEPFAGGAAVFFAKRPSGQEVLNDLNENIAFAYRTIQKLTDDQIRSLQERDWQLRHFEQIKDTSPKSDLDRLHKFLFIRCGSRGSAEKVVGSGELKRHPDHVLGVAPRLPGLRERLKDARVLGLDYTAILKQFDSPKTFFYLDPPYPGADRDFKHKIETKDLAEALGRLKGKFLLSINDTPEHRNLLKAFTIKSIEVGNQMGTGGDATVSGSSRRELMVANYPLRASSTWLAEDTMREQAPEKIPEDEVNLRPKDFPTMKCAVCRYFVAGAEPGVACKIVTRAEPELVCDAYQGATRKPTYEVADEDWLAFVNGMVKEQPYSHIVQRGFLTPEGPVIIIADTMKPKPHVFSLSKEFHLEHTGTEHAWQQDEVDRLIGIGKQGERSAEASDSPFSDRDLFWGPVDLTRPSVNDKAKSLSESFRIDLTYKPDEEPTHEQLEANRAEILKKFQDFVKAEFPKGEIKVELENLIPREQE